MKTNLISGSPKADSLKKVSAGIILSLLTAVLLILSFHPHNVWYFAFVALVPMLIAQYRFFPVKWSGLAPAIGVGGWLLIFLSGMFGGNQMGLVIKMIVLVIIVIDVMTLPAVRLFHEQTGYKWFVLQGIADWVGFEMIRSFIPPINTHAFIAQTMYSHPFMLLPVSVFSIYGLGMMIILINFVIAHGVIFLPGRQLFSVTAGQPRKRVSLSLLITGLFVLLTWMGISFYIHSTRPENPDKMRVAAIQHNYPKPGHMDTPESQLERFGVLSQQTRIAADQGAKLIVWPELGLGFDPQVEHTEKFKNLAGETRAFMLVCYGVNDLRGWRNEAVMVTPEGNFLEVYGKNHPTSPGEPKIISSGAYPVYDTPSGKVATLICNDMHWTNTSRKLAGSGARLIAMPTLEGPGIALEQVAQATLRAVENRVAVVKADVAYASVIIDPYGKQIAFRNGAPGGEAFALVADVELGNGRTIYNRTGDIAGWVALAGWLFFLIFQQYTLKKKRQ